MCLYFDPDGKRFRKIRPDGENQTHEIGDIFYTVNPGSNGDDDGPANGKYKIVLINTDRQKSKTLEVVIEDARGTGYFPL